jgi:hypothetical protein
MAAFDARIFREHLMTLQIAQLLMTWSTLVLKLKRRRKLAAAFAAATGMRSKTA